MLVADDYCCYQTTKLAFSSYTSHIFVTFEPGRLYAKIPSCEYTA